MGKKRIASNQTVTSVITANTGDLSGQYYNASLLDGGLTYLLIDDATATTNLVSAKGMKDQVAWTSVRDVTTYAAAAESAWEAIAIDDVIYYDDTQTEDDPDVSTSAGVARSVRFSKAAANAAAGTNYKAAIVESISDITTANPVTGATVENVQIRFL